MVQIKEGLLTVRDGYDAWATVYDEEDNPLVKLEAQAAPICLSEVAGRAVLDLGYGTGRHSIALAQAGAKVTAVDFSQPMLAAAQTKAVGLGIRFVQHDMNTPLPFDPAQFDIVASFLVTDHIPDLTAFLGQANRICRAGGQVLLTFMHPAMHLRNVTARFIDPTSGQRIPVTTETHTLADYVMASLAAGLQIEHLSEHAVSEELARQSPRSRKYIGWPMLAVLKLRVVKSSP